MSVHARNAKTCATCQYWEGARKIQGITKSSVEVQPNLTAKCSKKNVGKYGGGNTCSSWTLWGNLKK